MGIINKTKDFEHYVRTVWPEGPDKKREFKYIRKYYDVFSSKKEYVVDDQSWDDLSMDEVYKLIDRTYSSAGESMLYNMLRVPLANKKELDKRLNFIKRIKDDERNRIKIQGQLFDLSKDRNAQVINFISNDLEVEEHKRILFTFLGRILLSIFILLSFFNIAFIIFFVINLVVNGIISSMERKRLIEKQPMEAIAYVGHMIKVGKKILKLDCRILDDYRDDIEKSIDILKKEQRSFRAVSRNEGIDALNLLNLARDASKEAFGQTTFDVEIAYYKVARRYKYYQEPIKVLYEKLGEIDALIAIASYLDSIDEDVTIPRFINETSFKIVEGIHPLVEKAVGNSINIDKKGIVITGTNMSGKSTFLRMLGINIIFAQSFNFVIAKEYEAPFFNLVSSISPEDDVSNGKSYYLAEAEALLRIIKALDKERPVFCLIDEIFRGTNPVERIAASEEILRYIQRRNSISLVATHDRELTNLLEESHDFYYFSENVSEKTGLSFDYKLKRGVLKKGNAIKLLKYVGYPREITDMAELRVKEYE